MNFNQRIKIDYNTYANITVIFLSKEKTTLFSQKKNEIENSEFVKTCDKHVRKRLAALSMTSPGALSPDVPSNRKVSKSYK